MGLVLISSSSSGYSIVCTSSTVSSRTRVHPRTFCTATVARRYPSQSHVPCLGLVLNHLLPLKLPCCSPFNDVSGSTASRSTLAHNGVGCSSTRPSVTASPVFPSGFCLVCFSVPFCRSDRSGFTARKGLLPSP